MGRDLKLILKVSERCNINCTYCYYYNRGNDSARSRPAFVSDEVVRGVVRFVESGRDVLGKVHIIIHGGEPLMLKKARLRAICNEFRKNIPNVMIGLVTNGMLIDREWIDIFAEFNIGVAISIDGPQEYHDRERVDYRGRGTYTRVVQGIRQLREAADAGWITEPSALAAIDIRSRGDVVYHHLVRELGFRKSLDFLEPQVLHDENPSAAFVREVGRYLIEAFREWVRDDDPNIHIRIFNKYMDHLLGRTKNDPDVPTYLVVAVHGTSDMLNDDYFALVKPRLLAPHLNVMRNTLSDYIAAIQTGVLGEVATPHEECVRCKWFKVCRPPVLPYTNAHFRYKQETGFRNKMVHCEAYQMLFEEMTAYIRENTSAPVAA